MEFNDNESPLLEKNENKEDEDIEAEIQKGIREGFIAKVFGLLACQLIILFLLVCIGFANETIHKILDSRFMYYLFFLIAIGCIIIGFYDYSLFRKVPQNYIILTIFTFSMSWTVASFTLEFPISSVLIALGLTIATVVSISIYALFTKKDFTTFGGFLFNELVLLMLCSLILIFFPISFLVILSLFAGLNLFCIYLVYDIQLIVGNKERKISEDDYILAVMLLYLDVINIFARILSLVGSSNN